MRTFDKKSVAHYLWQLEADRLPRNSPQLTTLFHPNKSCQRRNQTDKQGFKSPARSDFGTKRSQVQILSPRPEKAGNRKVSGSFFIQFAQSAVFGAFFMQRMCNLGERAKDMVSYWAVDLADSWSPEPKGRRYLSAPFILQSGFATNPPACYNYNT